MRPIKDLLRLKHQHGLSVREIARSCGLPTSTVGDYLQRAAAAGLGWPLPAELNEEQLQERMLGTPQSPVTPRSSKAVPDWPRLREELRRKGVTLQLPWREYRQAEPAGYAYSRFCELYREWVAKLDPVLRQVHGAGEKLFVDWAGQTVPIYDPTTGTVTEAHVFVAVLGASNKTFVAAFPNEQLPAWIAGHVQAYAFFGGVAKATVPDNPKTAVSRGCKNLSVNCSSSIRLCPSGVRRSEGKRSEPSAAEPGGAEAAPRAKNWSRAGHIGFLLGCLQTHPTPNLT